MQTSADRSTSSMMNRAHGRAGPSMKLAELAAARPEGLTAEAEFKSSHMVYPYGAHVVRSNSMPKPAVAIERYLVAFDIGKAVNPMLVEGQIVGGLAQGLGGALFEEFSLRTRRSAGGHLCRLPDADGA